jgi:predicted nucleic acid-binding Zn ribbon protein
MARSPGKPVKVGEVLDRYLKRSGLAERVEQARVVTGWAGLVGAQIARVAAAVELTKDGTLKVRAQSSGWAQELSMMEPEIIRLVNRGSRKPAVKRIRWTL